MRVHRAVLPVEAVQPFVLAEQAPLQGAVVIESFDKGLLIMK